MRLNCSSDDVLEALLALFLGYQDGLRVLVLLVALLAALPPVYYVYCVLEALADGLLDFPQVEALVLEVSQGLIACGATLISAMLVEFVLKQVVSVVSL